MERVVNDLPNNRKLKKYLKNRLQKKRKHLDIKGVQKKMTLKRDPLREPYK